jgi:hypothetical protein
MPDLDRLRQQLQRVGAKTDCPICGTRSWAIGEEDVLLQAIGDDSDLTMGKGYVVHALTCRNCGFVRLHAADFLERSADAAAEREQRPAHDQEAQKESS